MLKNDIQKLEAGSLVTLIEVDCTEFSGDILYFHGHCLVPNGTNSVSNPLYAGDDNSWYVGDDELYVGEAPPSEMIAKSIFFDGYEYKAWPCSIEGIEFDSSGTPSSPTLSVSNIDGSISSLCLYFDDLLQARVCIRQTLVKYLDSENFSSPNPDADPTQQVSETWYVDTKTQEDSESITWSLSSPANLSGQIIPARLITGVCEWALKGAYRGAECGYTGLPMFDMNDDPTTDPSEDKCAGVLPSCKCRFGEDNPLPFGGFPAASLLGR